ncbi:helix-turn-helix transcriptional regulator [Fischerella sp. JS2]|uniref:helix-turn-helix transcriptional regulator n=1 Tax=Fischerella sp. JS2 TaxID=2597771 RepID=UPI0028E762DE|nr:helix-turn-helix transcriptional regulator [Fischerella sp. JS2]
MSSNEQNHNIASSKFQYIKVDNSSIDKFQPALQIYLMQAVLDSFVDGVLILTTQRQLIYANEYALDICHQLRQNTQNKNIIPDEIWCFCESMIEGRKLFPKGNVSIEIDAKNQVKLRVRARWLDWNRSNQRFLLLTLEDCQQTSHSIAIADAKKYGLTEREAQVWMLRRANFTYREIADRLYITINTVKKHLKNIYAKQQEMMYLV